MSTLKTITSLLVEQELCHNNNHNSRGGDNKDLLMGGVGCGSNVLNMGLSIWSELSIVGKSEVNLI